jgi:predicted methyltransferase
MVLLNNSFQGNFNMHPTLQKTICSINAPLFVLTLALSYCAQADTASSTQHQLEKNINGSWRAEENRVRDTYRHPLQTLSFFGVKPNATVIELFPSGKAYYTEILAPFLHDHGQYIAINVTNEKEDAGQKEKFAADPVHYDKIKTINITPPIFSFGADNSADYFLTFRNVHNFAMMKGAQAELFKAIFKVLKPGGILGVVDHRAAEGKTLEDVIKSGYLPEAFVIAEAEKAGFKLQARSDINNNPKDTKDYPKGVWTLPPTLEEGDKDRAQYLAIGESDRMTLRFVKPKTK